MIYIDEQPKPKPKPFS